MVMYMHVRLDNLSNCILIQVWIVIVFLFSQADAIQEKIGFPDYIMNNTALDLDYEGVGHHSGSRSKADSGHSGYRYRTERGRGQSG